MSANIRAKITGNTIVARQQIAQLYRDVEAFDAICGPKRANKPLKPPPTKFESRVRSAGELALLRDIKSGAFVRSPNGGSTYGSKIDT
jgi:hypothetical protein